MPKEALEKQLSKFHISGFPRKDTYGELVMTKKVILSVTVLSEARPSSLFLHQR